MGVDPPFGLYSIYPSRQIALQPNTVQEVGLQSGSLFNIEPDSVEFDPLIVFEELLPTEVYNLLFMGFCVNQL